MEEETEARANNPELQQEYEAKIAAESTSQSNHQSNGQLMMMDDQKQETKRPRARRSLKRNPRQRDVDETDSEDELLIDSVSQSIDQTQMIADQYAEAERAVLLMKQAEHDGEFDQAAQANMHKAKKPRKGVPTERTNNQPLNCIYSHCSSSFLTHEDLQSHLTIIHNQSNNQVIYQCLYCPTDFPDRPRLIEHIKLTHPTEKPFFCRVCGEQFDSWKNGLKEHKC